MARVNALCRARPALPCTGLAKRVWTDTGSWTAKAMCRGYPNKTHPVYDTRLTVFFPSFVLKDKRGKRKAEAELSWGLV